MSLGSSYEILSFPYQCVPSLARRDMTNVPYNTPSSTLLLHKLVVPQIKPATLIIIYNLRLPILLQYPINNGIVLVIFTLIVITLNVFPLFFPLRIPVGLMDLF